VAGSPRLATAAQVMEPLAPYHPEQVWAGAGLAAEPARRDEAFAGRLPESAGGLTLAQSINAALADALAARPGLLVFGEDVARKGGVYGVTRGLAERFGATRVFDTLLDEQSILGLALGAGLAGLLPVPEVQYLAYLHNAADQIRGEAATMSFFSQGQYRNPLLLRIASLAYQEGFGGHFHNDNALASLREIPGLIVACPARPDDAAAMLRTCLATAEADGLVAQAADALRLYCRRCGLSEKLGSDFPELIELVGRERTQLGPQQAQSRVRNMRSLIQAQPYRLQADRSSIGPGLSRHQT